MRESSNNFKQPKTEESTFEITSKKSYISLVIAYIGIVFFLLSWFHDLEIEARFFITFIISGLLIFSATLLFKFFNIKNNLVITKNKFYLSITHGYPQKIEKHNIDLNEIKRIILKQTHESKTGTKAIKVYTEKGCHEFKVNFRYYQLVKIEDYFNENTKINTELIG